MEKLTTFNIITTLGVSIVMDIILYNIAINMASLIVGYLFGSIPFGIIIGKGLFHRDPRNEGSHNSGGTNVGRIFGKRIGFLCIALDMMKCILPMIAMWAITKFTNINQILINEFGAGLYHDGTLCIYLITIGALIGHCYPLYAGFKGGKAVSTYAGFILATNWALVIIDLLAFFIALKKTKYVSLSSIILSIFSCVFSWILFFVNFAIPETLHNITMWGNGFYINFGWEFAMTATVGSILIIIRHIPNIKRLLSKCESKVKWIK